MLLGRERELAELRRLFEGARAGHGGAILIVGDAGIGKTALWRAAVTEAADLRLLEAQGIEAESQLAFAGLRDLLTPVLSSLKRLPVPQRDAVAGALALGPPAPGDPFAVAAATLGLLAAASPAVAVVDDAHWLDPPSAEAILFAARRLRGERVGADHGQPDA